MLRSSISGGLVRSFVSFRVTFYYIVCSLVVLHIFASLHITHIYHFHSLMSSINHLYKTNNKTNRLLKIGYEKKLRQKDNELQAKKGVETTETPFKMAKVIKQPNLEDEDTGTQWKNDPVE